jgi:hypothetical protein
VHTEGVTKIAALLLHVYEDWQGQQPAAAAAAAGRKQLKGTKQAAPAPRSAVTAEAAADVPSLLAISVMNNFFAAAADVARAAAADDEEAAEAAAADAVRVAEVLFTRQLLQVKTDLTNNSSSSGEQQPLLSPDAQTYAALAQLYGAAGQYKTLTSIVMAAVRHQLPLAATRISSSSRAEVVQTVLSGAAGAWLSAGRAAVVPCLLDGLVASGQGSLSHPGLAAAVLAAADDDLEVRGGGYTWQAALLQPRDDVGFVKHARNQSPAGAMASAAYA